MTSQDLKNSILQLAMQGKLVEQRAEEGTAEELYQQIQEEKAKLIKAGKIKKEKPLPEISEDEVPFDIPDSWRWIRLGECISLLSGQDMPPDKYNESGMGIPYLTGASNIENGKVIINRWTEVPKVIAVKGNLLVTCKGTIGKTCIVSEKEVHIARQIMAIASICVEVEYIHVFIQMYVSVLRKKAKSMIPGIERKDLLSVVIPLSPISEQKRIVSKIKEFVPLVEQYGKAYENLESFNARFPEDMRKSILQYAMQGKLVGQRAEEGTAEELYRQIQQEKAELIKSGKIKKEKPLADITEDEIPFDIPESWKWVRFQHVCKVITCGYASTPTYVSSDEGMPFISAKNVKPYRFLLDDHKYISKDLYETLTKTCKPERNDILLTRVGAGIGEAAIIDTDIEFAIYVSLTLIKLVDNKLLDNRFVLHWLNSPMGISTAIKNIYGKGASQGNLNVNNVRNYLFPLPPLEEQKRIVAKIEELLPYCECLMK